MFPLFETIRISDGNIYNLEWHQWRFELSCKRYFGKPAAYKITEAISLPDEAKSGLIKLHFRYNANNYVLKFEPYKYIKISSLKVIGNDAIEYALKYRDRSPLDKLRTQKGHCDDILIVKKGLITDTSFTNIVFYGGKKWITPKTPLLKGTCRERLLQEKKIFEADIKLEDLNHFTHFKLINAMRDFDESENERIENIYPRLK